MQKPTIPLNEKERLAALREYHILDSGPEKEFEELTQLASEICQTPISLVTLIDEDKQWFKAGAGLPVSELARDITLCAHAIIHPFDPFVVSDLRKDKRFSDHPFVNGEPHVVFYASIPLTNPDGYPLGTLCVFDKKPKTLSENQLRSLKILAKQVVQLLELRKANFQLNALKENLESRNEELQQFAYVVSHDIKSPLSSIVLSSEMLRENFGENIDEENDQLLSVLNRASVKIKNLVDGILAYYRAELALSEVAETFQLRQFFISLPEVIKLSREADIIYPQEEIGIFTNKTALEQILVNLLENAIKYNDKDKPLVIIAYSEDEKNYNFSVKDNGRGISPKEQEEIFELFATPEKQNRFGTKGSGTGLSIVKKLVERMSGMITVQSFPGKGSTFSFSIKKQMSQPDTSPYS